MNAVRGLNSRRLVSRSHWPHRPILAGLLLVGVMFSAAAASAQEKSPSANGDPANGSPQGVGSSQDAEDLLERDPFCRLTLDAANDNRVFDIMPPERIPEDPKPGDRPRVRLLEKPGQLYEVQWRHIARLRTYDELVLEEARRLTQAGQFQEAFRYFSYLRKNAADLPGLERAVLEYLLKNADQFIEREAYHHGLAVLEEVVRRDANYQAAEVAARISTVADQLISAEVERGDYAGARGLITRLEDQYSGARVELLGRWREKLISRATDLRRRVERKMAREQYRAAERLSREMVRIWPDLSGAAELRAEIARRYPMVIVGVSEPVRQQESNSISSWARRRIGSLTQRTLVQFIGAGPEGGQYLCPRGEYYQSDDRRQLTLRLARTEEAESVARVDGYDVSRRVLAMADPASSFYQPSWASLIRGTRVEDVFNVHILLRHPHVLPEAMLQIQLDQNGSEQSDTLGPGEGPYRRADSPPGDEDVHFVANARYPFPGAEHPAEIVERRFESSEDAVAALRRGDIDVIDYLFPDDVQRLRGDESLQVRDYSLPTIHVLVPNHENPFTADPVFRRALLYGINRKRILEGELLGNQAVAGCQVLSGPFPVGTRKHDPLAYAYNDEIQPRAYYPRLALVLKTLAHRSLRKRAEKRGEKVPGTVELVIGHPGNEVARVVCQAISQYLRVLGIECELRELSAGRVSAEKNGVDLLYVQAAMWEPIIDARRLLAPAGMAAVDNEYVGMALRRLEEAGNWREVRSRLRQLHRITHEQVPVIPLWQTVDYLAHTDRLAGIGSSPLTLYQDVEQWQVVKRQGDQSESARQR